VATAATAAAAVDCLSLFSRLMRSNTDPPQ
jgi:hypothetical protein